MKSGATDLNSSENKDAEIYLSRLAFTIYVAQPPHIHRQ